MKQHYIGVFDSGLGGLTTVKEIIRQFPEENIIFLADTLHLPYGSKSREEIISYTQDSVSFLKKYGLKALIIACNTSDSNAGDLVRSQNGLPVYGVIAPAVAKAVESTRNKRVGLIATEATIATKRYEKLIHLQDEEIVLESMACPKLVPMIEKGLFINGEEQMKETLREYIDPLIEKQIDTLILGCTHYDLLSDMIRSLYPDLKLVSSSRCVVDELKEELEKEKDSQGTAPKRIFLCSCDPASFNKVASNLIEGIRFKLKR